MPLTIVRIGQRPLERVVLAPQSRREVLRARAEDLQTSGVQIGQGLPSSDQVERGPPLLAGLGEDQGPGGEVEGGQSRAPWESAEPAGFQ